MSEPSYVAVVEAALAEDATDAAAGGVPPTEIADRLDADVESVRRHCRRLAAAGVLEQVDGIDPETRRPRKSYLPSPTPDA